MFSENSCSIIAHRGASGLCGEDNTLASFRLAIALGCDYAETDLRMSADKTIICFHDAKFKNRPVGEWTYKELCSATGLEIPTLEQLLSYCENKIGLDLELKEAGYEQEIIQTLSKYNYKNKLILKSFNHQAISDLKNIQHDFPVGLLMEPRNSEEPLSQSFNELAILASKLEVDFISPHKSYICEALWQHQKCANYPILPWTVNSHSDISEACSFPIAGIISDRPDRCRAVLKPESKKLQIEAIHNLSSEGTATDLITLLSDSKLDELTIHTKNIIICENLSTELNGWLSLLWPRAKRILMVMDKHGASAIGNTLSQNNPSLDTMILQPEEGWNHITPHVEISRKIKTQAVTYDGIIAVGSGCVNDLCKYAAHELNMPYIACATAASMNGYTSSIAALLIDSLKSTVPCTPPIAVFADSSVIANAPSALTQSGYADLLSKYVSVSDWRLSNIVRGDAFNTLPSVIANRAIEDSILVAESYADNDVHACKVLMQAIILSGYSMALAGNSAPASGGEHLISHYLDMTAYTNNRSPELHGLQVALGSLLTCTLYEEIRKLNPNSFKVVQMDSEQKKSVHGKLWPILEEEAKKQILSPKAGTKRLQIIKENWETIWKELDSYLCSSAELKKHLRAANVPCTPEHYNIPRDLMRTALVHAADIRDRYSVLHFARDIGVLEDIADHVISRAFD